MRRAESVAEMTLFSCLLLRVALRETPRVTFPNQVKVVETAQTFRELTFGGARDSGSAFRHSQRLCLITRAGLNDLKGRRRKPESRRLLQVCNYSVPACVRSEPANLARFKAITESGSGNSTRTGRII